MSVSFGRLSEAVQVETDHSEDNVDTVAVHPRGTRPPTLESPTIPVLSFREITDKDLDKYDRLLVAKLARRGLSRAEARSYLIQLGAREDEAQELIHKHERFGHLDDVALAAQLIETQRRSRGKGLIALRRIMRDRGITAEVIECALSKDEEFDEYSLAADQAAKKLRTMGSLDSQAQTRRLYAFLGRRGFSGEVIRRVVTEQAMNPTRSSVQFR